MSKIVALGETVQEMLLYSPESCGWFGSTKYCEGDFLVFGECKGLRYRPKNYTDLGNELCYLLVQPRSIVVSVIPYNVLP